MIKYEPDHPQQPERVFRWVFTPQVGSMIYLKIQCLHGHISFRNIGLSNVDLSGRSWPCIWLLCFMTVQRCWVVYNYFKNLSEHSTFWKCDLEGFVFRGTPSSKSWSPLLLLPISRIQQGTLTPELSYWRPLLLFHVSSTSLVPHPEIHTKSLLSKAFCYSWDKDQVLNITYSMAALCSTTLTLYLHTLAKRFFFILKT